LLILGAACNGVKQFETSRAFGRLEWRLGPFGGFGSLESEDSVGVHVAFTERHQYMHSFDGGQYMNKSELL
jgi:hypothetical protein